MAIKLAKRTFRHRNKAVTRSDVNCNAFAGGRGGGVYRSQKHEYTGGIP